MAGVNLSNLKSIRRLMNSALSPQSVRLNASYTKQFARQANSQVLVRSSLALVECIGQEKGLEQSVDLTSRNVTANYKLGTGSAFASSQSFGMVSRSTRFGTSFVPGFPYRSYSSFFGGKDDKPASTEVSAVSGGSDGNVGDGGVTVNDWVDKVKDGWQRATDAVANAAQKAEEVSDEMNPHMQQLLDSHPYLKDVVVPVGFTLGGTILAWFVMPRLFRRIHRYVMQSPAVILSGKLLGDEVPYEQSFWGALEEPVRYLFTFMAFSQIAMMVAPNAIASEYLTQAWRGAAILSFVWFLYRWKTNVFSRAIASQSLTLVDRDKILTLDRVSSIGLFVIGIMALAEACGVAVQSILTVGGIGGVATAFAARDVLGNMLSGLSMQFSKPFSLGDTIKAGNIEGQVVEMGLTTTSLLNAEKFPVLVPNSLFSSQAIINKSRAQWRAMITKIPLRIDDVEKVYEISEEIKSMLKSNPKVSVEREVPYCYLSRVDGSCAELTVGCNLRHMRKDELYAAEQDILVQSVQIIKKHGAELGSSWGDASSR